MVFKINPKSSLVFSKDIYLKDPLYIYTNTRIIALINTTCYFQAIGSNVATATSFIYVNGSDRNQSEVDYIDTYKIY